MIHRHPPLTSSLPADAGPRLAALTARAAGFALLVLVGLFHVLALPTHYQAAPYLGVLFGLAAAGAWAAALGIAVGVRGAWLLGAVVCAATLGGLLLAATAGLPGFSENLGQAYTVPSLLVEALYLALCGVAVATRR